MAQAFITRELFCFLRDLKANNSRDWFKANKERYEAEVKEPLLAFIAAFAKPLAEVSPHVRADPRPNGGSLFRIYRDTRFGKDKSPYKTHAGIQFRHKRAKDVHAPGFYLHLEPGQVFGGAGLWHPPSDSLRAVRQALVEHGDAWREAMAAASACGLELRGESLKRPPRGFDADHPLVDDIKRKDFILVKEFDEAAAVKPGFFETYVGFCRDSAPVMGFLTGACGLEW